MADVIGAFFRGEEVEGAADEVPKGVNGSGLGLPQQLFDLAKASSIGLRSGL